MWMERVKVIEGGIDDVENELSCRVQGILFGLEYFTWKRRIFIFF
jgi:hypothetical protein